MAQALTRRTSSQTFALSTHVMHATRRRAVHVHPNVICCRSPAIAGCVSANQDRSPCLRRSLLSRTGNSPPGFRPTTSELVAARPMVLSRPARPQIEWIHVHAPAPCLAPGAAADLLLRLVEAVLLFRGQTPCPCDAMERQLQQVTGGRSFWSTKLPSLFALMHEGRLQLCRSTSGRLVGRRSRRQWTRYATSRYTWLVN
jgi:hypothetical protein